MRRLISAGNPARHGNQELWRALARAACGQPSNLERFDEATVLAFAEEHGISQRLERAARGGMVSGLGEEAMLALAGLTRNQSGLDLLILHETRKLLDLFAEAGLPVLLLKGTPVALLFYAHAYERPRGDTDLYIDQRDVDRAAELLSARGYTLFRQPRREYSSKQFVASTRAFQNIRCSFDIHWQLSNRVLFRGTLPFDSCYERRQAVPRLGPNACTLSTIDLLLHACIHRIAHGRNSERNRLIWLYDIHLIFEAMDRAQRDEFLQTALARQVGALCADALRVCNGLFLTGVSPDFLQGLTRNAPAEPSAKLIHSSKLRWAWADMMALKGIGAKAAFAKELLFH